MSLPHTSGNVETNWFIEIRTRLNWYWTVISLLLAGGWMLAGQPEIPLVAQLWFTALSVGIFGVLHGGLDHLVGQRVLKPKFMGVWWVYFLSGYVVLSITVMIAWWQLAPLMLMLFLLVSAIHFGQSDGAQQPGEKPFFGLILAVGFVPIVTPWIAFPQQVTQLFGWLANNPAEAWQPPILLFMARAHYAFAISVLIFVVIAGWLTAVKLKTRRHPNFMHSAELFSTFLLFWTLPPLLAFTWYFCFLHSAKHMLTLAERLAPSRRWAAVSWVAWHGAPAMILTIVASAAAYVWLRHIEIGEAESLTRVVFYGLAALTFPHMLLTWLWDRSVRTSAAR